MSGDVKLMGDPVAEEQGAEVAPTEVPEAFTSALFFADIARELHADTDPQATLKRIVDLAVSTVPGAAHAAITTVSGGQFTTVASTGDLPERVDRIQYEAGEGPCVDSLMRHEVYRANDLVADTRFPLFAPQAVNRTGVRSMLSFRLFTEENTLGALNLYAEVPDAFGSSSLVMGAVFAAHASGALQGAGARDALLELRDLPAVEVIETGRLPQPGIDAPATLVQETGDISWARTAEEARADTRALALGVGGLVVGLVLIWAFSSSPSQRPIAVLLVPVMAVALVASARRTAALALLAAGLGGTLFITGDSASADLRLRFAALLVGVSLATLFALMRQRRDALLRERAGSAAMAQARLETERILTTMLSRLPELAAAADIAGVARRACELGRDVFGADHVSYWQVEGEDCVLLWREPDTAIPVGTRVPCHLFEPAEPERQIGRTTWIRARDVTVTPNQEGVAAATNARVGTSTPIRVAAQTAAYLGMSWSTERDMPDRSWLDAVDRFADQIALAKTVIRRRIAQGETLALAQRFQARMLPRLHGMDLATIHALYRPGQNRMLLGGDFLDVRTGPERTIDFVVGDVAGHGPEQAALGATLRGAWLSLASIPALGPQQWAQALNHVVRERGVDDSVFVSALMGRLDTHRNTLTYVSAGHPPPILLLPTPTSGPLGDVVLGPLPAPTFTVRQLSLPRHWAVLLVTDGLFEGKLPGITGNHGNYEDFLSYLTTANTGSLKDAAWLNNLADTLEVNNGGPLSDDAAAMLLLPRGDE